MDEATLLLIIKISFIVFIFFLAIGAGMLPLKLQAFKNSSTAIGLANSFSGGLFLSIALFHVLPDVSYRFFTTVQPDTGINAPLPFILIFLGYTIVLTVDRVMFDSHALFDDHGDGGHGHEEKEGGHGHEEKDGHGHGKKKKEHDKHGHNKHEDKQSTEKDH